MAEDAYKHKMKKMVHLGVIRKRCPHAEAEWAA